MIIFIIQSLFWVLLAFVIGLLLGRYIKRRLFNSKEVKRDDVTNSKQAKAPPAPAPKPSPAVSSNQEKKVAVPAENGFGTNNISGISHDNLQIIEGIGPKMQSVLNENGIQTWQDLSGKTIPDLQGILNKYGNKYKIIQPATWVEQAKLAAEGKVNELITLQKVDGASKLEKMLNKGKKSSKPR